MPHWSVSEAQQKADEKARRAAEAAVPVPAPPPELPDAVLVELGANEANGSRSPRARFLKAWAGALLKFGAYQTAQAEAEQARGVAPKALTPAEAQFVGERLAGALEGTRAHTRAAQSPEAAALLKRQDKHRDYRQAVADAEFALGEYRAAMQVYEEWKGAAEQDAQVQAIEAKRRELEQARPRREGSR